MSARRTAAGAAGLGEVNAVNEVRLVGRLAAPAAELELPSGDVVCTFRVVVRRPEESVSRQRVDALECAAWSARARRAALGWRAGDLVEVHGAIRRRFFRSGAGAASRVEVEVAGGRVIRRAGSA